MPSRSANLPSVRGWSPTITTEWSPSSNPNRSLMSEAMGRWGLPAISGATPEAVATAANRAPAPGTSPAGVGWVGSSLVAMSRPDVLAAVAVAARRSKSKDRLQPTTAASTVPPSTIFTLRASRASATPCSARTLTDWPGASNDAAAPAELTRSSADAATAIRSSRASSSAVVGAELLVANTTRMPWERRAAMAEGASPMASPVSHTTPSRSTIHSDAALNVSRDGGCGPVRFIPGRCRWARARPSSPWLPSSSAGWRRPAGRPTRGPG